MEPELLPVSLAEYQVQDSDSDRPSTSGKRLEGSGTLNFLSGCTYTGQLSDGRMHGRGKMLFPDELVYEGEFNENRISGHGTYRWPGGGIYEGSVLNGKRHGPGRMSFRDSPVSYTGDWHHGQRHGQGTITLNVEGSHYYKGGWVSDQKSGQGTMQYSNGDSYEGQWEHDVKSGHGVMHWRSRNERYEGQWERNLPNGIGMHIWYQQLVTEPSPANHALLVQFNRYEGHFADGKRSGYGVMYYATGARYEGLWANDQKEGDGVYVFENGETWRGTFTEDRPVLGQDEVFAPHSAGVAMQIEDLVDEEEVPAAAARGVANVLMVFNTDLRALYDKYCKRPSLHLQRSPRTGFTLVSCQVWEMLGDTRLITSATPLSRVGTMLALARRPPAELAAFRSSMRAALLLPGGSSAEEIGFWDGLDSEHVRGGPHAPMQELQYREFCEFLVRLAASRYRLLPNLERRVHTLVYAHLLHQVSRGKAQVPVPPRTQFHLDMWAGTGMNVLQEHSPVLAAAWQRLVAAAGKQEAAGGEQHQEEQQLYLASSSVRSALRLLKELGLLPGTAEATQAAAAMTFNYLTINTYGYELQRPRVEVEAPAPGSGGAGEDASGGKGAQGESSATGGEGAEGGEGGASPEAPQELGEADLRELLCWLDQPMLYPDFVDGLARAAQRLMAPQGYSTLPQQLEAFLSLVKERLEFQGQGVGAEGDASAGQDSLALGCSLPV